MLSGTAKAENEKEGQAPYNEGNVRIGMQTVINKTCNHTHTTHAAAERGRETNTEPRKQNNKDTVN